MARLPFFCNGSILRQAPQVCLENLDTVAPISPPLTNSERAFFPGDLAKSQAWLLPWSMPLCFQNQSYDCTVREAVVQLCSQVGMHTHPVFLCHSLLSSFKVRSALEPKPHFFWLGWQSFCLSPTVLGFQAHTTAHLACFLGTEN